MQSWQPRADELIDELLAAEDAVRKLVGPRASVAGSGEPMERGPVIDEAFHDKWVAALERQNVAWDAWIAFLNEWTLSRQ